MLFLKNAWPFTLAALVVICIGAFVLLHGKEPVSPRKTYKAAPAPNQSKTVVATEHTHDSVGQPPHTHSHPLPTDPADIPSGEESDWRDESGLDSSLSDNDPWKQTYPESESIDDADETYPPRDWYKTEDPALYVEYLQAQLIKQFGDIPEVHAFVAFQERRKHGIPIKDADEYLNFLTAQYALWPEEETLETLQKLQKRMAEGANIIFGPGPRNKQ